MLHVFRCGEFSPLSTIFGIILIKTELKRSSVTYGSYIDKESAGEATFEGYPPTRVFISCILGLAFGGILVA